MTDHAHPTRRPRPRRSADETDPRRPTPPTANPVPGPIGDVVPGDPPVPITVWHIPRPPAGTTVSAPMARRLIGNYTRPGAHIIDLTAGGQLTTADAEPAALVITGWPAGQVTATGHLHACALALQPGGCLAVVIAATDTPDQLGPLVAAARAAGLTYLQHIVVAHHLTARAATNPDDRDRTRPRAGVAGLGGPHLRVHTDLLIMRVRDGAGD
jgi:hypothetical protein